MRALLEGTFQLVEWHVDGKILRPPEAEGRWIVHDGRVSIMLYRNVDGKINSLHGWGVYTVDRETWNYHQDHSESVEGLAGAPMTFSLRVDGAPIGPLKFQREGAKLMVIGKGADHREYDGEGFTQFDASGVVRKWRRVD